MGRHEIDGRVLRIHSGASRDSIIEHIREAAADPAFEPDRLLIDARELEESPQQLSTDLIRQRASEIARLEFRRCAVVPANLPFQRALASYFILAAKVAGMESRVFLTIEEAEEWLGSESITHLQASGKR